MQPITARARPQIRPSCIAPMPSARLPGSCRRSPRSALATVGRARRRLVLVAQPQPIHRVGQALFVAAERRQVEIVVGGIYYVEAAGESGISVEDVSVFVALKHADAGLFLDTKAAGPEIIYLGSRPDLFRRERDGVVEIEIVA